ncbi:MAG: hypothetical protein QM368_03550 [Bacillota bacterium]|nr:hypothetical protein [Bacillota bacterium]HHU29517.1 hypothetical protein [Bacillota bacterium]
MGNAPGVLAYPLEEALQILQANGFTVKIRRTAPPEAASCRGTERVVRLRRAVEGKVVEITVAEESPGPSPGKNTV